MDYLVYAFLQVGRDGEAEQVIQQLKAMPNLKTEEFKSSYASTVMPIRYLVERGEWANAAAIALPSGVPPQVAAIAVWAQGLGLARTGHPAEVSKSVDDLQRIEDQLRAGGNTYWESQVRILRREVLAWKAQAENRVDNARAVMRQAADEEDSLEKLPVTPGPIIPAREQLGQVLLQQGHLDAAGKEFEAALMETPGRRGSLRGLEEVRNRADSRQMPAVR
jgi:hypothetical protein